MDDAPNLLRFSYDIHHGRNELLAILNPNWKLRDCRRLLIKLILEALDTEWYSKLIESIGNFDKSRAITLSCDSDKVRAANWLLALPEEIVLDFSLFLLFVFAGDS